MLECRRTLLVRLVRKESADGLARHHPFDNVAFEAVCDHNADTFGPSPPIFEKYKCVSFPIFADYLGEVPLKSVNFPNFADFSGALARKVSKIWKIDTL